MTEVVPAMANYDTGKWHLVITGDGWPHKRKPWALCGRSAIYEVPDFPKVELTMIIENDELNTPWTCQACLKVARTKALLARNALRYKGG